MKRILLNHTFKSGEVYLHEGIPFTGIGFEQGDGPLVQPYEFQDGRIVGRYISLCEAGKQIHLRIDLEGSSGDYETITYADSAFTGMGYEFKPDKGYCYLEGFVDRGTISDNIRWTPDGRMASCRLSRQEFTEVYSWFPNGELETCGIQARSVLDLFVRFSKEKEVQILTLSEGTLLSLKELSERSILFPFKDHSDFCQLKAAKQSVLVGKKVDDDFVDFLINCGMLDNVEKLEFAYTAVRNLPRLNQIPRLNELKLDDSDSGAQSELAHAIKQFRPDLKVIYNKETLKA